MMKKKTILLRFTKQINPTQTGVALFVIMFNRKKIIPIFRYEVPIRNTIFHVIGSTKIISMIFEIT